MAQEQWFEYNWITMSFDQIPSINEILRNLREVRIHANGREKSLSGRDFLEFLGYSATANKSLEHLLSGEKQVTLEQLVLLERNVHNLKPITTSGQQIQQETLVSVDKLIRAVKQSEADHSDVMADLASATDSDLAEGKQYFQRFFREFAMVSVHNIWDVRKALIGLAYHASQYGSHFKITSTAARSVWQNENDKSDQEDDALDYERDRLVRVFRRLLRSGYPKGLQITYLWQLPNSNALKEYVKSQSKFVNVKDDVLWLRDRCVRSFSQLRNLISSDSKNFSAWDFSSQDTISKEQLNSFFPGYDIACSYNEENHIMYSMLLMGTRLIENPNQYQSDSAYLLSENKMESLARKNIESLKLKTNLDSIAERYFKPVLDFEKLFLHAEFESQKLISEEKSTGFYVRSYDYPGVLRSKIEFNDLNLRNKYKLYLKNTYFDEDKIEEFCKNAEKRVNNFNKSLSITNISDFGSKDIKIIMPVEAIFGIFDSKVKKVFGFSGIVYESNNLDIIKIRLRKLYFILNSEYSKYISFSNNDSLYSEMKSSEIFPNKISYIVNFFEDGKCETFLEKRDTSVDKNNQFHILVSSDSLSLGSYFAFLKKWEIVSVKYKDEQIRLKKIVIEKIKSFFKNQIGEDLYFPEATTLDDL